MTKSTVPIPHKAKLRKSKNNKSGSNNKASLSKPKAMIASDLLEEAAVYLQISRPYEALEKAEEAYALLTQSSTGNISNNVNKENGNSNTPSQIQCLPAINLLGDIYVELGEMNLAKEQFLKAIQLDPNGLADVPGGGAEKFLWMAQLCESGGAESIEWFMKGANVLRKRLTALASGAVVSKEGEDGEEEVEELKQRLGSALCGIAEVYMTDLSFDDQEAERRCEEAIAEAIAVCPTNTDVLQTLASIRISQLRHDEAKDALANALGMWIDISPEDPAVPPFPSRISLARMLLEVSMLEEATVVMERLILEDDSSVEAWYLGGWAYWLLYSDAKEKASSASGSEDADNTPAERESSLRRSRRFLQQCLKLYTKIEYEDTQLREHAVEIMGLVKPELEKVIGQAVDDNEEEEDEWEIHSDDDDDDEDMMDVS